MARIKQRKLLLPVVLVVLVCVAAWLVFRAERVVAPVVTPKTQKTSSPSVPTTKTVEPFDKTRLSLDDPTSEWVVVNKRRALQPKNYVPNDLTSIGSGRYLRQAAASALESMLQGAKQAGYTVSAASAYRSYDRQVVVYNSEVQAHGQTVADSQSARPGTSEHQTGWAVDLASGGCSIKDCFGDTPGGEWVTAHAADYGFVLRYPADKQAVTGYRTETWHFRYVGTELALEMQKQHSVTLEEFFGLPAAPDYATD